MNFSATFSKDLSQPEYVQVLINPLPVYGLGMGVLALLIAFMMGSRRARIVALLLIVVSATSAWPVFIYGKKGYQRVHAMSDKDGQAWLDVHMHRAEQFIYIYYVTAAVGLIAIVAPLRWPKIALSMTVFTLILALGLLCVGGYIAYPGGKVRHREFRNEPPPVSALPAEAHAAGCATASVCSSSAAEENRVVLLSGICNGTRPKQQRHGQHQNWRGKVYSSE